MITGGAGLAAGGALAAAGTARAASPPAPAADPYLPTLPHQTEAEQMIDYLRMSDARDTDRNQYKLASDTRSTVLNWGGPGRAEEYRALAQCSTFVTKTLMRAYGEGTSAGWATKEYFRDNFFPGPPGPDASKWAPSAEQYRAGFENAADILHIQRVRKPANLRPGDLVAIDYDDPGSPYTGHIVMIRKAKGVFRHAVDTKLTGDVTPRVFEIIDCTHQPHGDPDNGNLANYQAFPDSRFTPVLDPEGTVTGWDNGTGVGYGHMIFYSDDVTGVFAGYRWSVNSSSVHGVDERPVCGGRVFLG